MNNLLLLNATIISNIVEIKNTNIYIQNGKIHSFPKEEINPGIFANSKVIDCENKTVLTGFTDSHIHLFSHSSSLNTLDVSYPNVKNVKQVLDLISNRIQRVHETKWIMCDGFDELDFKDQISLDTLSQISKNHPVKINHRSGHGCFLNSAALKILNLNSSSEDPDRGLIERDNFGELTGWFFDMNEHISFLIRENHAVSDTSIDIAQTLRGLMRNGIFYLHDASINNNVEKWEIYKKNITSLDHSPNITLLPGIDYLDEFIECGFSFGFTDKSLTLGHTKIIVSSTTGTIIPKLNTLINQIIKSYNYGFPVAIHAVTEEEISIVLEALEKTYPQRNILVKDRIEHFTEATPNNMQKAINLPVTLVVNPSFIFENGFRYLKRIPKLMKPYTFNYRTLLNKGFNIAIGSDSPYGNSDPLINIQAMVNRKDKYGNSYLPNESIGLLECLNLITKGINIVSPKPIVPETLNVGDIANLIILNQNLKDMADSEVMKLNIQTIIKDGSIF